MASESQMKNPLLVGNAIRAQLEHEIPQDLPLDKDFTELGDYTITDHVHELHNKLSVDARTTHVVNSLVAHLHAFARETQLTHAEWLAAVAFLTRAGKESTPAVNEFVLLSDCLGLSVLVDELNHPKPAGCTVGCEAGPFLTDTAPDVPSGSTVASADTKGEPLFFEASIKNLRGEPVAGAVAELWQADGDGVYDVQYEGTPPNDRARIHALPDGTFSFKGVLPTAYPIPSDGPTGDMLRALGRHPHRASHLHFQITAPGYEMLTTALYPAHSPFLGTDPVFATKKSLVTEVTRGEDGIWVWRYDFVLPTVEESAEVKKTLVAKSRAT